MNGGIAFHVRDDIDTSEELRLKYRFLDLRRPQLQQVLMLRSRVNGVVRNALMEEDFLELNAHLTKATLKRREIIWCRAGSVSHFYALPQSPQLFKRLFMVAGYDRYFQICRCFRDEDLRADRQPEFTQIDIKWPRPGRCFRDVRAHAGSRLQRRSGPRH